MMKHVSQAYNRSVCFLPYRYCDVVTLISNFRYFTDTESERSALMETVFPKLREYAATKGVELLVVDPHWGIWDSKLQDERTQDLYKEEIDKCQTLSNGPNFVVSQYSGLHFSQI